MAWDRSKPASPVYASREYRLAKTLAVQAFRQGDPCWHCGRPMYADPPSSLHLEHRGDPRRGDFVALGLGHPLCNIQAGARRGRARQDKRSARRIW